MDSENPTAVLERARAGDEEALNELMGMYRNYLQVVARVQTDRRLLGKLETSDLIQETLLEAYRDFGQFAGNTERELIGWLRKIMVRNITNQAKYHHAQKRDLRREQAIESRLDRSSARLEDLLVANISSPSAATARRESAVVLANGLSKLSPEHRDVIVMRHLEELDFSKIADRMGRSSGAVRMLWVRALENLRTALEGHHESG